MPKSQADRTLRILLGVAVLAFLWTIKDSFEDRVVNVGDKAPDFSIRTETGKTITAADFGGKVLVLNFWATWCPPCVEEMPSLNRFAATMKDSGVVVLAVSIDKNEKAYKQFVQRIRPAFETAYDPDANISSGYGTFKWPETYVIDRNGKVRQKLISNQEWMDPQIVNGIKALL
jgi:cytochrome c biogenesis protein CcmG, thiol:disulfide interchange protein DsbE